MRIGRLFGIEIRLDYSWFIIFLLVAFTLGAGFFPAVLPQFGPTTHWVLGIAAALLLFFSVLLHELAHSLTARRFRIEVHSITLFIFGGLAQIRGEPRSARAEFLIAVVGPITSLVLAGLFWALTFLGVRGNLPLPLLAVTNYLWIINLALAIFNMLPGLPLDGGRVLRSILWQATGNVMAATRWSSLAGQVIGFGLIAWGAVTLFGGGAFLSGIWLIFIGWFLINAAQSAYQQLQLRRALSGVAVSDVMIPELPRVDARLGVEEFVHDYLLRQDYPLYSVMEDNQLRGLVGVEDVRRLSREQWRFTTVGSIAHSPEAEAKIAADEDAWDALTRMLEQDAPRLLVTQDGTVGGVVSRDALLRLLRARRQLGFG